MFDPSAYGPELARLLLPERLNALGRGSPHTEARASLERLSVEQLLAPHQVIDQQMGELCRAALWLYHDCLEESHRISQSAASATGCYWHALMHRREGDFWNSKYWFRQVGQHPVFERLANAGAEIAAGTARKPAIDFLTTQAHWDPSKFVDLCEACTTGRCEHELLCRRIQQREWQLLFDYCFQRAIGCAGH